VSHRWCFGHSLVACLLLSSSAAALGPVTWNVSLSTSGQDVFWTSPTAVTPGFPEYDWSYKITTLTANVLLLGNQNVLSLLGDDAMGSGSGAQIPLVVVDDVLDEPTTGTTAHILIDVDAAGFGHASGTEIHLGTLLGLPIRRIDLAATISVLGVPTGDYNRNGDVDAADYAIWRQNFGSTTELAADGNGNLVVDAADYTWWRDNFESAGAAAVAIEVPESTAGCLVVLGAVAAVASRDWRWRGKKRRNS
jgi:Dockerin type I domain